MTTLTLNISGMTCAACANRVEKVVNKQKSVTGQVNFGTEKLKIDFDENIITIDAIKDVVKVSGYELYEQQKD